MTNKFIIAGLCGFILAGCEAYPVAVVGDGGTVYRGVASATLAEGGWFQATDGANTCSGQYTPARAGQTVTFPVRCTNGLSGIGSATYENGQSGGGTITMEDGSRWRFIFGRGAAAF